MRHYIMRHYTVNSFFKKYLKSKKKADILKSFDDVMAKMKKRVVEDWDKL